MKTFGVVLLGTAITGTVLVGLPVQEAQAVTRTIKNDCYSERPFTVATKSEGGGTRTKIGWCNARHGDIDSFKADAGCYTILKGKMTISPSTTRWYSGKLLDGVTEVLIDCWA